MPLHSPIDDKWIACFSESFRMSGIKQGDLVYVLSETRSSPALVQLAELGLGRIGARVASLKLPSAKHTAAQPIRSTGASDAADAYGDLMRAIGPTGLVVDVTVEGILHSPARQELLSTGGRVYMISHEHPEVLERCMPNPALIDRVDHSLARLGAAQTMRVTSAAGTDLTVDVSGAPVRGGAGFLTEGQPIAYWPAGLALCFPLKNTVNGTVVLNTGDVNLTFKRYFESPVCLTIENDRVTEIAGDGLDAVSLRSYFAAWDDPEAYTISHVGWGLNPGARWDSLHLYDKNEINATELRAVEGNFLISTGANEFAGRYTPCHFDFPMRDCSVWIDDAQVVGAGRLLPEFK
ncbi:MAG: peptidase M29 [Roseovarius sp.]